MSTTTTLTAKENAYLERVRALMRDVEGWIVGTGLTLVPETVVLVEEKPGSYDAPMGVLRDAQGRVVASLKPIGAWIIAADGRVDLVGAIAKEILLYFSVGGRSMSTRMSPVVDEPETVVSERSHALFKGVTDPDWYWLNDLRLNRAERLDREIFLSLLESVSDREFSR